MFVTVYIFNLLFRKQRSRIKKHAADQISTRAKPHFLILRLVADLALIQVRKV